MTDARFPERWLNDRRIMQLPDDAFRLFVLSLAWSAANRTDGALYDDDLPLVSGIPRSVLAAYTDNGLPVAPPQLPGPVQQLVKAGLWERVRDYWLITVFEDTQTSRAELDRLAAGRRTQANRQRRYRAHQQGDHSLCGDRACAAPRGVTRHVTRDSPRPGQDRHQRETTYRRSHARTRGPAVTAQRRRPGPSRYLLRRIPEVVAEPRWGGGLSRADLAAELHVREYDPAFRLSLLVCLRRGQVSFCRDYVVAPWPEAPPGDSEPPF